jgi:hypothetical protein
MLPHHLHGPGKALSFLFRKKLFISESTLCAPIGTGIGYDEIQRGQLATKETEGKHEGKKIRHGFFYLNQWFLP